MRVLLADEGVPVWEPEAVGEPLEPSGGCLGPLHRWGMPSALRALCVEPGLCSEPLKLVLSGQGGGACWSPSGPPDPHASHLGQAAC